VNWNGSYTLSNVHVLETVSGEVLYMFADVSYFFSVKLMEKLLRVFNSPMLHLLRVEMVINSPWIMPILGTKELASPEQTDLGSTGRLSLIPTGRVLSPALSNSSRIMKCREKLPSIVLGGVIDERILVVQSDRTGKDLKPVLVIKMGKYLGEDCVTFLAHIEGKEANVKSIKNISIKRNHTEVFLKDLSGLPPTRIVEFWINLVPRATPLTKALYHLAPLEIQALFMKIQELLSKLVLKVVLLCLRKRTMCHGRLVFSAGSESRPPMLNKENYVPWSSRLLRYAKSRPNGKLIHNSILNGPYVRRMIPEPGDANHDVNVTETFHEQTNDELFEKELKQIEADDQAIQTILFGLPEDIYTAVDSCETAQEIWLRPEWSRHVTIVHQTKDLHTADYTQLNDFLKYNQKEVAQNPRVQNVGNHNGLIGVQRNGNQNQIGNGNLVAVRAEENAAGHNGNQISALVYDFDGSAEVHEYENCYNNEIFNMFTQEEQYTELLEPIPEPQEVGKQ
nr:hypothetical protein [Tanacetum cinerariifolium]